MAGRDRTRNAVSPEKGGPTDWDVRTGRNIKWKAHVGSFSACEPIVSGALVCIGANNSEPRDLAVQNPAGILVCFRERDGAFVYQHACVVTDGTPLVRRAMFGQTGSPLIEGDRLWFVTVGARALCLDLSPIRTGQSGVEKRWQVDFLSDLDVSPAVDVMGNKGMCSIGASLGSYIYLTTGNGRDWSRMSVPIPRAPGLVCLDKNSGKLIWEDASVGSDIILGEFGNPLTIESGGLSQVIAPQGDGWIRSFDARSGELLWKFDINPKASTNRYLRNFFQNAPVLHGGRILVAGGRDVESGEWPGRLVCLDPEKRGDISLELQDRPRRGIPNPNVGAIWHFDACGRTLSNPVVDQGIVVLVDFGGTVHALDEATGSLFWKHRVSAQVWGSPLVVDGKIYIANIDGEVDVLALGKTCTIIAHQEFEDTINSSPTFANGVLYIASGSDLFAIQQRPSPVLPASPE
jgi:outer membrane protein assembly factor BamB